MEVTMRISRLLLIILTGLAVASCKIKITVPDGGRVTTESGAYDCAAGEICTLDVVDIFFDETFIAEPGAGFAFKNWQKKYRGLCGGKKRLCRLFTSKFGDKPRLMAFLETDEVFFLEPIFINLTPGADGPFEDASDDLRKATEIHLPYDHLGSVGFGSDVDDFYMFEMPLDREVSVSLTGLSADLGLYLGVFLPDQRKFRRISYERTTDKENVHAIFEVFPKPSDETGYFIVGVNREGAGSNYRLRIKVI